jgi:hypothetical protein
VKKEVRTDFHGGQLTVSSRRFAALSDGQEEQTEELKDVIQSRVHPIVGVMGFVG